MFLNPYVLPNLFCLLSLACMGVFIFAKNRCETNFTFLLLIVSTMLWQAGTSLVLCSNTSEMAFFWTKISYIGVTLIPVTMFHFVTSILSIKSLKHYVIATYLIALFLFLPLVRFNFFLEGVHRFHWGYWFKATELHPIFIVGYSSLFFLNLLLLFRAFLKEIGPNKERIRYLLLALFISFGGAIDYFTDYGIKIYPLGFLFVLICLAIIVYAILRHRLMDIHVVIKKGMVYSTIIAIFTAVYVSAVYIITRTFESLLKLESLGIAAVLIFMFALAFHPLKTKINEIIDKLFFKSTYEYHVALSKACKKVATATSLEELKTMVSKEIRDTLKVGSAKLQMFE
ncbi:MAG: histidine kinase N-terminal 7TM domain-containing protein [Candidatus Margulisiibacteriota bacterium]